VPRIGWGKRSAWLLLLAPVLLAVAVRLPAPPEPEAAEPWIRGSLAIQGVRLPGDAGDSRGDLLVSLPLIAGQNVGFIAARAAGKAPSGDRGAWIREHEGTSRSILWGIWIAGAVAASLVAARAFSSAWGLLAGLLVAIVPIGIAGTRRLDAWALAAPLALFALLRAGADDRAGADRVVRGGAADALAWGAILSLTPLGWILALPALLFGGKRTRFALLFSIPIWLALDPSRIADPIGAVRAIRYDFVFAGWPGIGDGPIARLLIASWTPGIVALVLAVIGAWRFVRDGRFVLATTLLLLWIAPALFGARRPDGIGLIAPVAVILAVAGTEQIFSLSIRGRKLVAIAMALLLMVPVAWGSMRELAGDRERRDRALRLAEVIAGQMKGGGLLLRDPAAPPVPDSIPVFALPTHVERPEIWDFAYWPGWYGSFSHVLMSVRTLESIEREQARRPAGRTFLLALAEHADPIVSLGDPATDRRALILFRLRPGVPWSPDEIRGEWERTPGGKTGAGFLTDLAGFLAQQNKAKEAIEILRLALKWDDSDPRTWNNLGSTLLLLGDAKAAAESFEQGLRHDPESAELRYNLAKAYMQGKIPSRAVMELRRVIQRNPGFAPAHYDLARAAAGEEDWALAAQALEAYLSLVPNPPNRAQVESALGEARRRADAARAGTSAHRPGPAEGGNE
jgi:hypothetical protein